MHRLYVSLTCSFILGAPECDLTPLSAAHLFSYQTGVSANLTAILATLAFSVTFVLRYP